ncbi:MAG: hypothetical protein ACP5JJ_00155 [Anaerolineae bacterium]
MTEPHILVRDLSKTTAWLGRKAGLIASVRGLVWQYYRNVQAVRGALLVGIMVTSLGLAVTLFVGALALFRLGKRRHASALS